MRTDLKRDWWKRRRVWWPLTALLTLSVCVGLGIAYSGVSRVVVYNQTGASIAQLTISAGRQAGSFRDVGDRESVRFALSEAGEASDIVIATNGFEMWRGDYIEPRGGYRAVVRLRRDGQAECITTISWWQGLLRAFTDSSATRS